MTDDEKTPWKDPNVIEAIKSRPTQEISLIQCHNCLAHSYYNDGSHFTCQWCQWTAEGDELDEMIDQGEVVSLDDWCELQAETEDVP